MYLSRDAAELPTVYAPATEANVEERPETANDLDLVPLVDSIREKPIGQLHEDVRYTKNEVVVREVPENDCIISYTEPKRYRKRTYHIHLDHRDTVSNPVFYDRNSFSNAVQAFRYRLARKTPPCAPCAEYTAVLRS